jgi:hypothetical protein
MRPPSRGVYGRWTSFTFYLKLSEQMRVQLYDGSDGVATAGAAFTAAPLVLMT